MAQEQGKQHGSLDDSLFFDKNNAPGDIAPPIRGLLRRGWRCQADNARLENGLWFPPWARDTDAVVEANLHGYVMRPSNDPKDVDADGNPLSKEHWEPLRMQSGRDQTGSDMIAIKQTIITPAHKGCSFHEALAAERARERAAADAAAKAQSDSKDKDKQKRQRLVPLQAAVA